MQRSQLRYYNRLTLYIQTTHPSNTIVLYIIMTAVLRDMITNKKYFRTVVGGDVGSNSKNFLFKLDVFTTHAKVSPSEMPITLAL